MSAERIEARLRAARAAGRTALLPYLVAGFPARCGFDELLLGVDSRADVIELGLPFTDPTADGPIIAAAARHALAEGVHLGWVCARVRALRARLAASLVLMSYLNPLLAVGLESAVRALATAGFDGLIVPDVPLEEGAELRALADAHGLALVQLVTPLTPPPRRRALAAASRGFLYAVTRAGTTGARTESHSLAQYLGALRTCSPIPVCAGFGVRTSQQVRALAPHCDGVVVGSALIELLQRGESPLPLLDALQDAAGAAGVTS